MAAIKLKALRDRRPKTEDITVELPSGDELTFLNPIKRKGAEGIEVLNKLNSMGEDEIEEQVCLLAENGRDDLEKMYAEELTLEDLLEIMTEVGKKIEEQVGSLGESKG